MRAAAAGQGSRAGLGTRAPPVARARDLLAQRGGVAVFPSRWLVSALGPHVNLAAGAAGLPWPRFTLWSVAGEAVWVGLYVGLGRALTGNLKAASSLALNLLGALGAGAVGARLMAALRAERAKPDHAAEAPGPSPCES